MLIKNALNIRQIWVVPYVAIKRTLSKMTFVEVSTFSNWSLLVLVALSICFLTSSSLYPLPYEATSI